MASKTIKCDVFHATFGTNVSEQGACNLLVHEKDCVDCAKWVAAKREFDAVEDVTCERFREIVALGESRSEVDACSFYKHRRNCLSTDCHNWYEGNVVQPICNAMNGWTPRVGDFVRITDGPFENFRGRITEVGTGEIEVYIENVFGRPTTTKVFRYAMMEDVPAVSS